MNRSLPFRRRLAGAAALSLSCMLMTAPASAQSGAAEISLPAAPLGEALRAFSQQTGLTVVFTEALVQGKVSGGVMGAEDAGAALAALLDGTGLEGVAGGGGYVIRVRAVTPPRPETLAGVPAREATDQRSAPEAEQWLDQVTVTGTSLRGIAPESSPLQIFSREDILGSGVTTTEQFIRTLPQNFGGGSSEFVPAGLPNDSNSRSNYAFGTGANLRGLGSGGTLVLLNGNRLAPTSAIGDFVDLSLIPVSALERVDVLTDGASSIYGGDAVAGVINFVLRQDFEGAETSLRHGGVTEGSLRESRLSQALGKTWQGGSVLATAEYGHRGNLPLADRPAIAAPSAGASGAARLLDLMPEQERVSAVMVVNQALTPSLDVSATGLYARRTVANSSYTTFQTKADTASESTTLTLSADYVPSARWSVSGDVTLSRLENDERILSYRTSPPVPGESAFGSEVLSGNLIVNGDLFSLPAGPVKLALGGHLRSEDFYFDTERLGRISEGARDVGALFGEVHVPLIGSDNTLPGVQRLEVNLSGRHDDYSDFGTTLNPKVGLLWSPAEGLNLRSSYSTSFTPPPLGRVGDQNRTGVVYPYAFILGVFGFPLPDPSLAGTDYMIWAGTVENLQPETSRSFTAGADFDVAAGPHRWTLQSTYYDIRFEDRLGSTPVPNSQNINFVPNLAFANPELFPAGTVLFFPTRAEIDALVGSFSRPVVLEPGTSLDNIGIINNASAIRNLAATETRGMDASLAYEYQAGFGHLRAGLNANYILDFTQQAARSTPAVQTLNTLYNPVDLRLRRTLGLTSGGVSGNLFVNYTDSYRTEDTAAGRAVEDWTTLDLSLSYSPQAPAGSWRSGTTISLSVLNLLDAPPPETPTNSGFRLAGYDPTNASPLGRFIAVELRKAF